MNKKDYRVCRPGSRCLEYQHIHGRTAKSCCWRGHHEHVRDHDVDGERGDVSISNWDLEHIQLGLDLKVAGNKKAC